jgi:hypothetical protein
MSEREQNTRRTLTHEKWVAEARQRFGDDSSQWAFVCPVCGHVAKVQDWKDAGASEGAVAFSCVGRWTDAGSGFGKAAKPCDYAGGGLFRLNPVTVTRGDKTHEVFEFADSPRR